MNILSDLIGIIGFCFLSYGLYLVSLPLALCVSGALLIVLAVLMARNPGNDTEQDISGQHSEGT